jgi:PPK2 family polyphosphate:nucleotide phosphotransferase
MARAAAAKRLLDELRVPPGKPARLAKRPTDTRTGAASKAEAAPVVEGLLVELDALHDRLWAEAERSVLLVLQGMDSAGKDGAIRKVLTGLNPQGCHVASFKTPSHGELAHDYLWRVHAECPSRGKLGVFNRSHYEDVVAAQLVGAVTPAQCKKRFRHIQEFERMLTDEGTTVVKVFLHISKDEQRKRLQTRIDDPAKRWKFHASDLETRKAWGEHAAAYETAITETSTEHAPWYVVPADHKWARDVAVATLLVETFERLDPQIPEPDPALEGLRIE